MTNTEWLCVSTLVMSGMWLGTALRDRFPRTASTPRQLLAGALLMSSVTINALMTLADVGSFEVRMAAAILAFALAVGGLAAAVLAGGSRGRA